MRKWLKEAWKKGCSRQREERVKGTEACKFLSCLGKSIQLERAEHEVQVIKEFRFYSAVREGWWSLSCHMCLSPHFLHEALGSLVSSYALPFAPVVSATLASNSLTMPGRHLLQGICTWYFPSLGSSSLRCPHGLLPAFLHLFAEMSPSTKAISDPPISDWPPSPYRHTRYPNFLLYFLTLNIIWFCWVYFLSWPP